MELKLEDIDTSKVDIIPQKDFARRYANNCSLQNVAYLIDHDRIDGVRINRERYVILNEKTLSYEPKSDAGIKRGEGDMP